MDAIKRLFRCGRESSKETKTKLNIFGDRKDKWLRYFATGCNLLAGANYPLFLYLLGELAGSLSPSSANGSWMWIIIAMILTAAWMFVVSFLGSWTAEVTAERQLRTIRTRFLPEIMRQEIGFFDQFDATTLATQLGYNCQTVRAGVGQRVSMLGIYIGFVIAGLFQAFRAAWDMTLVTLATVPFIVAVGFWATRTDARATVHTKLAGEQASSVAQEAIASVRTVKAFSMEKLMSNRFSKAVHDAFLVGVKGGHKAGLGYGLHLSLMFISFAIGFWYGVRKVIADMEAGTCVFEENEDCFTVGSVITCFWCVVGAAFWISKAGPILSARAKARDAVHEIYTIYSRPSEIDPFDSNGITDRQDHPFHGEIQFKNVQFRYPTRKNKPVFSNLNLTVLAGKSNAFVGGSGCGKSTVVQMIMRFYNPESGQILVDGTPISDYQVKWLREQIAIVSQEPRLFAATIRENIAVGRPYGEEPVSLEEIVAVAKEANAHDFISAFPNGYDTWVGEGGSHLSGGQKQRIAIARAILRNPKLLILDEATSALDNESERIVQETLSKIIASRTLTTIIIAHRLTTIRGADRILVFDNPDDLGGVVVEQGTHDDLAHIPNGLYAALVSAQIGPPSGLPECEKDTTIDDIAATVTTEMAPRQQSIVRLRSKYGRSSSMNISRASRTKRETVGRGDEMGQYRRTIKVLRRHSWKLALGIFGSCLNGLVWPMFVVAFSYAVDAFLANTIQEMKDATLTWSLVFAALGIGAFFGVWLQTSMTEWCGQVIVRKVRIETFDGILRQNLAFYDDPSNSAGYLLGVITLDALALKGWGGTNLGIYIQCLVGILVAIVISLVASWRLGLVAIACMLVIIPVSYANSKLAQQAPLKSKAGPNDLEEAKPLVSFDGRISLANVVITTQDTQTVISEVVLNVRTVTAFNLQQLMTERFVAIVEQEYIQGRNRAFWGAIAWGLSQCLILLIVAGNFYYGFTLLDRDQVTARSMLQGVLCLTLASMSCGKAFTQATSSKRARSSAERIYSIIDHQPAINDYDPNGAQFSTLDTIEFRNVHFNYPQRLEQSVSSFVCARERDTGFFQIFNGVSFSIKRGEVVALVGCSGCGKSTIVQLLQRFYDVSSGSALLINGTNIQEYSLQSFRTRVGLVTQEPILFRGTIEENILFGNDKASPEDVRTAAKQANADNFVSKLPDAYQTDVGQGGGQLSGGQKQRIAISRALIRRPALLILDEATSALDAESERVVQEALNALLKERAHTTLIIAHRLSTIRNADKIVVFINPDGLGSRIAEVGTHEQLIGIENGVYQGLVRIAVTR